MKPSDPRTQRASVVGVCQKAKNIQRTGLLASHRKNVPISKKGMNYVFSDRMNAGFFASEMNWKLQKPVSVIKMQIPKKWIHQDTNTRAIIGKWHVVPRNIPRSRIVRVIPADDRFFKHHMKLFNQVVRK